MALFSPTGFSGSPLWPLLLSLGGGVVSLSQEGSAVQSLLSVFSPDLLGAHTGRAADKEQGSSWVLGSSITGATGLSAAEDACGQTRDQ